MEFLESGLQFVFDDDSCYRIELSQAAEDVGEGIKKTEFLYLQDNNLWVLEAKSSVPNPKKDQKGYDDFWQKIYEKLYNSLQLTVLGLAGRHDKIREELPEQFTSADWSKLSIRLVLVIPEVPIQHLPPLTEKLRKMFTALFLKLWNIKPNEIMVLNHDLAKRESLCQ